MRIGIFETGRAAEDLEARFGRVPGLFVDYLSGDDFETDFVVFEAYDGEIPDATAACDGYIVTGSRLSVLDDEPWMRRLKAFVVEAAKARPVLGVCFGHQLIAEAFGGRVKRSDHGFTAGIVSYQTTPAAHGRLPKDMQGVLALFASHGDVVDHPPRGAHVLAGGATNPNGLLAVSETVLTTQLHPEWTPDYAKAVYERARGRVGNDLTDTAIASADQARDSAAFRRLIIDFFEGRGTGRARSAGR